MDLATVFGLLLAWGVVLFSMWHVSEGAHGRTMSNHRN